jgi:hypothetical protein
MSSIPYNINIPLASHNPSIDQPNMETNNNNIATFVSIDHIGFNTAGSGQHAQVSFYGDNIPSLPTATVSGNNQGILFTNVVAGGTVNQLFYYAGTAAQSSDQYSAAANQGSTFLLGGIIAKWGIANTNNPAVTTAFSQAFPNACFIVLLTNLNSSYTGSFAVTGFTASNFTAQRLLGTGITGAYFLALGY